MTTPYERTRAILETKQHLQELADPEAEPRERAELQRIAELLLRHYPSLADIEAAHKALPEVFGPVPPFSRAHGKTAITELGLDKIGDSEFEALTPEQYAVLANAQPREHGKVLDSLLPADDLEEAKQFAALGGDAPEMEKVPRRRTEAVADADLLDKGEQSNAKKS